MVSRTSRILLALAVVALAAFFLLELPRRRALDRVADDATRLSVVDAAAVDALTITRRADTMVFVRHDGRWRITSPIADLADPNAVESLLNAIESAVVQRRLDSVDDQHPFGLDAPEASVVLAAGADTLLHLDLGHNTVDHAWTYARAGTSDVLLISTAVRRAATRPVDAYRDPRVVWFGPDDVAAYRLRTTTHATAWTRSPRGWFCVVGRDTVAGDSVAVETVLRRLRGLRVARFVAPTDSAGCLRHPACVVSVSLRAGGPPVVVRFAPGPDSTWLAGSGTPPRVVVLSDRVDDLLEHTTTDLRDRRLLQFFPPDALGIEIVSPGASGTLVRVGGAWAFPNSALGAIDPERAAELVRVMRALKWTGAPDPASVRPAAAPGFSVVVRGPGGTILDELTAWPRSGETRWRVSSRSNPGPWLVEASSLEALADRFRRLQTR